MANNKNLILNNAIEIGGSTKGSIRQITAADITGAGYAIDNAAYNNINISVAGYDTTPYSFQFKPDGTKLYLIGNTNDKVYQFSLSTAWDLSTTSPDNKDYATGFSNSTCFAISTDGTKLYVQDYNSATVYEYSISTAWDISTVNSTATASFTTTGQQGEELRFKPDGTRFYLVNGGTDVINQYSLSTAWDLSTASTDSATLDVSNEESGPIAMTFNDDGTLLFVAGFGGTEIQQYSLSTAWDVSTASYDNISFTTTAQTNSVSSLFFSSDGTKMYFSSYATDGIYQLTTGSFSTNFNLSDSNYLTHTLTESATYTFNNAGNIQMFQLEVTGSSGAIISWPTSVTWLPAEPFAPGSGEIDLFTFITTDGGTTYFGVQSGDNFS